MKKFFRRISELMITFYCLFYNFCYADLIDPMKGEWQTDLTNVTTYEYSTAEIMLKWLGTYVLLIIITILVVFVLSCIFKAIKDNQN